MGGLTRFIAGFSVATMLACGVLWYGNDRGWVPQELVNIAGEVGTSRQRAIAVRYSTEISPGHIQPEIANQYLVASLQSFKGREHLMAVDSEAMMIMYAMNRMENNPSMTDRFSDRVKKYVVKSYLEKTLRDAMLEAKKSGKQAYEYIMNLKIFE